ncbi:MAG: hypothetical protein KDC71_11675 [Acidobacteria bacterium]|nr:hypothetical protein [Acidobacteriota bacterium]
MNLLPLATTIAEAFLILESSGDEEINPDTAVRGMENLCSILLTLSMEDQKRLRQIFYQIESSSSDSGYKIFIKELPNMIGLAS